MDKVGKLPEGRCGIGIKTYKSRELSGATRNNAVGASTTGNELGKEAGGKNNKPAKVNSELSNTFAAK